MWFAVEFQLFNLSTEVLIYVEFMILFSQAREKYEVSDDIKRLDPSDIANAIVYAVTQPAHCAVNEIMLEPTDAPC